MLSIVEKLFQLQFVSSARQVMRFRENREGPNTIQTPQLFVAVFVCVFFTALTYQLTNGISILLPESPDFLKENRPASSKKTEHDCFFRSNHVFPSAPGKRFSQKTAPREKDYGRTFLKRNPMLFEANAP